MNNPLLTAPDVIPFDQITPDHARDALRHHLKQARQQLEHIEQAAAPTWDRTLSPLIELTEPIELVWGLLSHMHSVMNTDEWRTAHDELQPEVVTFFSALGQNQAIYPHLHALRHDPAHFAALSEAQQRLVHAYEHAAETAGAACPPDKREQLTKLNEKLAMAASAFANNVMDATKQTILELTTPDETAGLPPSLLQAAATNAKTHGHDNATATDGPWLISLEYTLFLPFMQYSQRRDLREKLYRAFITKATEAPRDNTPLIEQILNLRQQVTHLLGRNTYAELALETRMAPSVDDVDQLIQRLQQVAFPAAQEDHQQLQQFATEQGFELPLANWDIAYWTEKLRKARFDIDDEQLRPYFPFENVLQSLYDLAAQRFGIRITPADPPRPVWHPDVRTYTIFDAHRTPIAHFYLDPYSRPATKRGGAWMNPMTSRHRKPDGSLRLPAACIACNQSPPQGNTPSLMTLSEVTTLFHEFGHALHHLLTTIEIGPAAGVGNVEWDAVELPSQFMENWCYHRPLLKKMARHFETGEALPDALIDKIIAARKFRAGSQTLRQTFFAALDLELHHRFQPGTDSPHQRMQQLSQQYTILPPLPEDRFLCAFSHIFAGGYAAGYYSYKWAEVLAADAFEAFIEAGLDNEDALNQTGRRFRDTVLAMGGGREPMRIFNDFRGRDPDPDALLRQDGLL